MVMPYSPGFTKSAGPAETRRKAMSNGARHALGAVFGVLGIAAIFALLGFGTERMFRARGTAMTTFGTPPLTEILAGLGPLLAAAIVIGIFTGSRLSPLASLLPGIAYLALGIALTLGNSLALDVTSVLPFETAVTTLGTLGILALIGAILLAGSVLPSRWRKN
jgi:hypothetical protein